MGYTCLILLPKALISAFTFAPGLFGQAEAWRWQGGAIRKTI